MATEWCVEKKNFPPLYIFYLISFELTEKWRGDEGKDPGGDDVHEIFGFQQKSKIKSKEFQHSINNLPAWFFLTNKSLRWIGRVKECPTLWIRGHQLFKGLLLSSSNPISTLHEFFSGILGFARNRSVCGVGRGHSHAHSRHQHRSVWFLESFLKIWVFLFGNCEQKRPCPSQFHRLFTLSFSLLSVPGSCWGHSCERRERR